MLPEREDGQHLAISISRMTDTDLEIDTIFLFMCQTSYCTNLRANKQIPFDL